MRVKNIKKTHIVLPDRHVRRECEILIKIGAYVTDEQRLREVAFCSDYF